MMKMADQDTSIGVGQTAFRTTQWGRILEARAADSEAVRTLLAELAATYWRPVYKYIRIAWKKTNEEAKDLTQEFFAEVFRPEFILRADRARGNFRQFVLASIKNFLRDAEKSRSARKRGGGVRVVPLDDGEVEIEPADGATPEEIFHRAWAEALLAESLKELGETLEERGRGQVFRVFREYCMNAEAGGEPTYRELAGRTGLSASDITNYLYEARRELRRILIRKAGASASSWGEVEKELQSLFGI